MKTTAEMKNNVNECTKVGDVCMIKGFESTMVNVERKEFKTIAWTCTCSELCHTKKEAMEIAEEEMFVNPEEEVMKASFYICLKSDSECWTFGEEVPLNTKIGAAPIDEEPTDEEIDNNYKIICDFIDKNGVSDEHNIGNGDVIVRRSLTLDIEGFGIINIVDGEEVILNHPTIVYTHKLGELDGDLELFADELRCGISLDDIIYAEIFAEAIKNGDIQPLPIEKVDDDL